MTFTFICICYVYLGRSMDDSNNSNGGKRFFGCNKRIYKKFNNNNINNKMFEGKRMHQAQLLKKRMRKRKLFQQSFACMYIYICLY